MDIKSYSQNYQEFYEQTLYFQYIYHKIYRRISSVTFTTANLYGNVCMRVGVARALADSSENCNR